MQTLYTFYEYKKFSPNCFVIQGGVLLERLYSLGAIFHSIQGNTLGYKESNIERVKFQYATFKNDLL